MKNAINQIKKYWLINLVSFIVSIFLGVGIFCLVFFLRNRSMIDAIDGAALGSVSVLFIGLIMWVNHLGAFDMFAFGFKQFGSMLFAKDARRDGSFHEYKEDKMEKRNQSSYNFVAIVAAGLLLSIAVLVLEIIYNSSI